MPHTGLHSEIDTIAGSIQKGYAEGKLFLVDESDSEMEESRNSYPGGMQGDDMGLRHPAANPVSLSSLGEATIPWRAKNAVETSGQGSRSEFDSYSGVKDGFPKM